MTTRRYLSKVWKPKALLVLLPLVAVFLIAGTAGVHEVVTNTGNVLTGQKLFVDPNSHAAQQVKEWKDRPEDAANMAKLAGLPVARWYSAKITYDEVHGYIQAAATKNEVPVTVAYYIPNRDCNKYSQGGAKDAAEYREYIDTYVKAIGNSKNVVILEPDALNHIVGFKDQKEPCLSDAERTTYYELFNYAVTQFKTSKNTIVYIDAGNSSWMANPQDVATRLKKAGIHKADGFSLNVSNFRPTDETIKYGEAIASRLNNKHFVIDTSRNGLGPFENKEHPDYNWCNPPGRALGTFPTTMTGKKLVDAYLYIKAVGESDGADPDPEKCFGGPQAGEWWPDYALGLIQRHPQDIEP